MERSEKGRRQTPSPIQRPARTKPDPMIYFLTEREGESIIIEPGDKLNVVARNKLNEVCKASVSGDLPLFQCCLVLCRRIPELRHDSRSGRG